jgi:hypothetical protein
MWHLVLNPLLNVPACRPICLFRNRVPVEEVRDDGEVAIGSELVRNPGELLEGPELGRARYVQLNVNEVGTQDICN